MTSEIRVNSITNRSGLSTVTWNDEGLNVVGVVTATSFVGNVTGAASQLQTDATGANLTLSGNLGVGGTITYEDVARVDATGISTFREGFGVGPLAGIALTAYTDGSIRTSGIITATTYYGSGAQLTGITGTTINNNATTKFITGTNNANELDCEANLSYNNSLVTFSSSSLMVDKGSSPTISAKETSGNKEVQLRADTTGGLLRTVGSYPVVLGTNQSERMRIDGNGKVIIAGGELHSSRVLARFGIDCHGMDIFDGVGTVANYGMAFYNDPTSNKANGIGFFNDDGQTCGGYIVHQDKGGSNVGDLIFATSASANTPAERLRLGTNSNSSSIGSFGTGSSHLNNCTTPDRASFKVGGRLHVEGAFGHNAMTGLYYNCYSGGNDLFYSGTYAPSGGDGRACAITMRYGGVAMMVDNSSTAYSPTNQITTMQTALSTDRNGYVTTPATPSFFAQGMSGSTFDSGTMTGGNVSSIGHNIGSHYNTSNGIFTAPVAGRYLTGCGVLVQTQTGRLEGNISKNNSTVIVNFNGTGTTYDGTVAVTVVQLAANDNLRVKRSSGNAYDSGHGNHYFFAHLIG